MNCEGSLKIGKSNPDLSGVLLNPPLNSDLVVVAADAPLSAPSRLSRLSGRVRSRSLFGSPGSTSLDTFLKMSEPLKPLKLKFGSVSEVAPPDPSSEWDGSL